MTELLDKQNNGPFPRQLKYVSDDGGLLVDYLGRQETLAQDMCLVLAAIGAPYHEDDRKRPARHSHGDYDWKAYFADPKARRLVNDLCGEDIEHFSWTFPEQFG